MADVNGYNPNLLTTIGFTSLTGALTGNAPVRPYGFVSVTGQNPFGSRLTPGITYYYQMECTDALNTNTTTWVNQGAPDFGAVTSQAVAAITSAGLNTPVRQVRITSQWPTP